MHTVEFRAAGIAPIGALLREWRAARRLSQLSLALDAGVSARHLSYVETGKAQPSRELVDKLADTLAMPLRERNALLVAAGYAPKYPETPLATPMMAQARRAIDSMLAQQEPYPAFLLNRHWDVLAANAAAGRVAAFVLDGRGSPHQNMLHNIFDPADLRSKIANWEEIASDLMRHLHSEMAATPTDAALRGLLERMLAYPDVPQHWRNRDPAAAPTPLLAIHFRHAGRDLRFFSTITTFGTPRDVTLEELRIECAFPEDEATAAFCRELAERDPVPTRAGSAP